MPKLIQTGSTAAKDHLLFLMIDSSDHVTGKTGLTVTVTLSKAGGSFASPSGAVTEIANGWYKVAANATDNGTVGDLLLHATASGADPTDDRFQVVAFDVSDAVRMGLTALPNAAAGASGGLPTGDASGRVDLGKILGTAVSTPATAGILDVNLKNIANAAVSTSTAQLGVNVVNNAGSAITAASGVQEVKVASIAANAITATAINADAITDAKVASDVTIASVTGAVGSVTGAVGSVTGLTASDVGAIKAKTDNLPASPAAVGSAMTLTAAYDAAKTAATQTSVDVLPTTAPLDAAGTRTAVGLSSANLDTQLGAIAGYIDTEVGAIYSRIGAPVGASISADIAAVKAVDDAVKAKTDQLTFTSANELDANIHSINDVALTGTGIEDTDEWRPA